MKKAALTPSFLGTDASSSHHKSMVAALAGRRSAQLVVPEGVSFNRQVEYDKLAGILLYWLRSTSVLKKEKRTAFFGCSLLQLFEGICVHF
jgi:hypothetical protein